MYAITKGPKHKLKYLGFDDNGRHEWATDRLDAIRFNTEEDGRNCCRQFLNSGAKVVKVDEWDGRYETYLDYEIQVFKDGLKGKLGGRRWRYRYGPIASQRAYTYAPGTKGYTTPQEALSAAKKAVKHASAIPAGV